MALGIRGGGGCAAASGWLGTSRLAHLLDVFEGSRIEIVTNSQISKSFAWNSELYFGHRWPLKQTSITPRHMEHHHHPRVTVYHLPHGPQRITFW